MFLICLSNLTFYGFIFILMTGFNFRHINVIEKKTRSSYLGKMDKSRDDIQSQPMQNISQIHKQTYI